MHQLELSRKRTEQYRTSMAVTEQRTAELLVQREKLKKEHSKGLKKGKTAGEKEREGKNLVEIEQYSDREEMLYKKMEALQFKIQRESHRSVMDVFGPGPHFVRITFELPTSDNNNNDNDNKEEESSSFVVEMAPIAMMPHSVHVFLEQVAHGLWTGGEVQHQRSARAAGRPRKVPSLQKTAARHARVSGVSRLLSS